MTKKLQNHSRLLTKIEDQRASSGTFGSEDQSIERVIHETQVKSWDTRKALALSTIHREELPISFIRSLIQRGNLSQAREALAVYEFKNKGISETDPQFYFEKTRLEFFESNWSQVIKEAELAFAARPAPSTKLALYQLRSNAYFELGEFSNCGSDIEAAEILGQIFPHAVSMLYVKTLKVRLIARDRSVEAGRLLLEKILNDHVQADRVDLDLILTCLRVMIDLNRLSGRAIFNEARACFLLSDAIGDKLYCGLAELDYLTDHCPDVESIHSSISETSFSFERVKNILREISLEHQSTSAQAISQSLGLSRNQSEAFGMAEDLFSKSTILVTSLSSEYDVIVNLKTKLVRAYPKNSQIINALKSVSQGVSEKAEFFLALWGRQKYSKRLHDTLISSLFHRIRSDLSLEIRIQDGKIHAPSKWLEIK